MSEASTTVAAEAPKKIVFQDLPKYPTRDGIDFMAKVGPGGLDPNRPLPKYVPQEEWPEHMWDRAKAIPPKYLEAHWRNYAARYIPEIPKTSIWERLFGSQEALAEKNAAAAQGQKFAHPCHAVDKRVRDCLDRNADKAELAPDYCRPIINVFEGCLREFRI